MSLGSVEKSPCVKATESHHPDVMNAAGEAERFRIASQSVSLPDRESISELLSRRRHAETGTTSPFAQITSEIVTTGSWGHA